jgi:hypothetical protein
VVKMDNVRSRITIKSASTSISKCDPTEVGQVQIEYTTG